MDVGSDSNDGKRCATIGMCTVVCSDRMASTVVVDDSDCGAKLTITLTLRPGASEVAAAVDERVKANGEPTAGWLIESRCVSRDELVSRTVLSYL